jgi:hypothetical protein
MGDLLLASGTALASTATVTLEVEAGGTLRGAGTVDGLVRNYGTVRPERTAGSHGLTFERGFDQRDGARLEVVFGPFGAGGVTVTEGTAYLAGTLHVSLDGGQAPVGDGSFTVLTATAISGAFAAVELPEVPGFRFDVVVEPAAVVVTVTRLAADLAMVLDVKPGDCPNAFGLNSRGVLPVALAGSENLDVRAIDPGSLLLEGVAPLRWSIEDVTAFVPGDGGCAGGAGDGIDDLALKFPMDALLAALGPLQHGDEVTLTLEGTLLDGTPFSASDIAIAKGGGKGKKSADGSVVLLAESAPHEQMQRVRVTLAESVPVRLEVYDVRGRRVAAPVAEVLPAGDNLISWSAANQPSGVYFYRLVAGPVKLTDKILVVR